MNITLANILELARFSVQSPRAGARYLLDLNLPLNARWLMFWLVATAAAVLTHVGFSLLPVESTQFMAAAMTSPIRTAALQAGFLLLTVLGVYHVGRSRGGKGNFADALLLVSWLQVILLGLQVAQIAALLVLPPVAEIIGVVGLVLSFWLLTQFIMELHGFTSAARVFLGIIVTLLAAAFVASVVIAILVGAEG